MEEHSVDWLHDKVLILPVVLGAPGALKFRI